MIVKDFRKGFYETIQHQRVLVLVGFDVDGLCACKILQYLFQCDQILYTIVPVVGKEDLERAFVENSEGIKYVLMINCGANLDVVETLQPEDHVIFYICDSHRPVDIHNVYNAVQVKLLMNQEDLDEVPEYDSLFRDDESDDDSGNDSDASEQSSKRRRFNEEALDRRREKRVWNENRNKILFSYTQFSSYGTSAALTMFELAWKMSKDTNDLLWLAIIGVTDQYVHYKTPREKYIEDIMALQSHVSRHNRRTEDDENIISINCLKIVFDDELQLALYRHWSLFESLRHSVNMACKFKVWTQKGQKRLHEFLAEMGMPLSQCKQKYTAMDSSLRGNIKTMMQEHMTKYGLVAQDVVVPSFSAQYGYKNKLSANDVAYAAVAVLESIEKGKTSTDNFLGAVDVLQSNGHYQMAMEIKAWSEGTPDVKYFSKPQSAEAAQVTLEATVRVSLGKAFEQAASATTSRILQDSFDFSMVEMKSEDKNKFFDALISLLQ
ncbi:hypothetical protein ScPMuIL_006653 [Solemya velum]